LLDKLGEGADFITVPDIVAGGLESLRFSEAWAPRLVRYGRPLLLPVQDGMLPEDVDPVISSFRHAPMGLFVGGSTEFKLGTLPLWAEYARMKNAWLHVGRVNSRTRIRLCQDVGADSFDGSGASRWAKWAAALQATRVQASFFDKRHKEGYDRA
jgi:hypothetical protein